MKKAVRISLMITIGIPIVVGLLIFLGFSTVEVFRIIDQNKLKGYVEEWFVSSNLPKPKLTCRMNRPSGFGSTSRAGVCLATQRPNQLNALRSNLSLRSIAYQVQFEGCSKLNGFSSESHRLGEVDVFNSDQPPPPIYSANTTSSFERMYVNTQKGDICIDLVFPYG